MNKTFRLTIVAVAAIIAAIASAQTRVIAHRGYWDCAGSAQNSVAALIAADKTGAYGSEFDVYITKDGKVVVNHDPVFHGINIETANYNELKNKKLKNGENIPTLEKYLEQGKTLKTKLILEIKPHKDPTNEDRCVDEVLRQINAYKLKEKVEYISFSMHVCERLAQKDKDAIIAYLGSDISPQEIKSKGLTGIDYYGPSFATHPEWINEAHKLGLTVNVWTIDDLNDINDFIKSGVDFITTNKPLECIKLTR